MQVATAQEALFMACEMESSAIQLYTRALSLMEQLGRQDEPLYDHLTLMRADEQEHLAQFRALGGRDDLAQERRVALSAAADNILFEGGLMGAARAGLLRDVESMLRFAMLAEETSASKYREFASLAALARRAGGAGAHRLRGGTPSERASDPGLIFRRRPPRIGSCPPDDIRFRRRARRIRKSRPASFLTPFPARRPMGAGGKRRISGVD